MEIIPCRQATFLITKREGHALTLRERFQLYVHLAICKFCRRFSEQTKLIAKAARRLTPGESLSEDEKRKMQEALKLV
jgi:predicted anti-sigma-YlaC factor YlaD